MNYFLHFGIHKTGSSFMQRQFFCSLKGVQYCDCRDQYHGFLDYLLHADEYDYKRQTALEMFTASGQLRKTEPVVLSDEMFYAPMQWSRYSNRSRGCDRLADLFPGSKVSIVFRNQRSLLASFYRMYIKTGGTASWENFLQRHISEGYLHYGSYLDALIRKFGVENVKVFIYEDFVDDPVRYLNGWCDWLGVDQSLWNTAITERNENPSISPRLLPFMRSANRILSSRRSPDQALPRVLHGALSKFLLALSPRIGKSGFDLCPDNDRIIGLLDGCREGNRYLAAFLDRDLNKFHYIY